MRLALFASTLAGTALLACACARAPERASAPAPVKESAPAAAKPASLIEEAQHEKRPRHLESAVYVDGVQVGVLRALEMPAGLKPHAIAVKGAAPQNRYFLGEYLRALGVDLAKVKGIDVFGGARVAVMDGDELRRVQDGLQLTFTAGDRGKPRLRWAAKDIKVNTTIDVVSQIAVYVDKAPVAMRDDGDLYYADGTKVEGVPYAPREASKGTRVYVDGKLVSTVQRKALASALVVGEDEAGPRFSLAGYLTGAGVDAKNAKALDFISGDDVILRADGAGAKDMSFAVPRHNQGQVAIAAGSAKSARVSALEVFIKTNPPARTIVAPTDGTRGGGGGNGGGGGADEEL